MSAAKKAKKSQAKPAADASTISESTAPESATDAKTESKEDAKNKSERSDSKTETKGDKPARSEFKSAALLTDDEIRARGIEPHEFDSYRKMHYRLSFAVEKWSAALGDQTFRSELLALSFEEAEALIFLHRRHSQQAKQQQQQPAKASALDKAEEGYQATLNKLEQRLDELAAKFPTGFFVKLNTRSVSALLCAMTSCIGLRCSPRTLRSTGSARRLCSSC